MKLRITLTTNTHELAIDLGPRESPANQADEPPYVDEKRGDTGAGPGFGFSYKDEPINSE